MVNGVRIWRNAGLTALALGLATLAWGSGIDRMARATPALARIAPEGLRANAWRAEAALALQGKTKAAQNTALTLAARAVVADPGDAASLSLLGAARFAGGDGPGAAAAFRIAGTLGWRDQPTQLYWLVAALQARDYAVATQRLDALLRQAPHFPQSAVLLGQLGASPGGRAALARQLAERPRWFEVYLSSFDGVDADRLAQRAAVMAEPALAGARVTCPEIGSLAGALYAMDRPAEARALWRHHCATRKALLVDGGFEAARLNDTSPFAWQFAGEGGLDLRLDVPAKGSGQALVAASTLPQRRIVAVQALQLAAGRYDLAWTARDAAGAASPRIAARLTCKRGEGPWLATATRSDGRRAASAAVPATCAVQWLELALDSGAGAIVLDDVSIAAAN